jgi:glutathione S-transferase
VSLILHHADGCPYCVRTRLVLDGKGVEYEEVRVDLRNKPEYLRELNPRNRVPVLIHDGIVLTESEALDEYLDEVFPDPPMMPADPAGRAVVRALMRRFEDLSDSYYDARLDVVGALETYLAELASLDQRLSTSPYLAGDTYTLAEPGYWPWIVRAGRVNVALDSFPSILAWCELLEQRPEYLAERSLLTAA